MAEVASRQHGEILSHLGLAASVMEKVGGGVFYAEIEPAPRWNWRPWRGRMSRWWFEVHETNPGDECGTTYAYSDGGSGGGFTLRSCIGRANEAVEKFYWQQYEEWKASQG